MRLFFYFILALLANGLLFGCAQNTESPVSQPINQPVRNRTDQAAQGSYNAINVNIGNGGQPAGGGPAMTDLRRTPTQPATTSGLATDGANTDSGQGGQIINANVYVQTGGDTGPQSASGGASGSQQATPNATVDQRPEMKPEVSVAIPVTVAMPGASASGTAAAAGRGSTISLTHEQQADLRTALFKAQGGNREALGVLGQLFGVPPEQVFPKTPPTP